VDAAKIAIETLQQAEKRHEQNQLHRPPCSNPVLECNGRREAPP